MVVWVGKPSSVVSLELIEITPSPPHFGTFARVLSPDIVLDNDETTYSIRDGTWGKTGLLVP